MRISTHVGGASSRCTIAELAEAPADGSAAQGSAELETLPMTDRPTCVICLGMAGSGKTTFVQVSHT